MPTYEVTIMRTAYATVFVDAENEDEASERAWDKWDGQADDCAGTEIYSVEELEIESN